MLYKSSLEECWRPVMEWLGLILPLSGTSPFGCFLAGNGLRLRFLEKGMKTFVIDECFRSLLVINLFLFAKFKANACAGGPSVHSLHVPS